MDASGEFVFRRLLFDGPVPLASIEDVGGLLALTREWDMRSSRSAGVTAFLFKGGDVIGR